MPTASSIVLARALLRQKDTAGAAETLGVEAMDGGEAEAGGGIQSPVSDLDAAFDRLYSLTRKEQQREQAMMDVRNKAPLVEDE